MIVVVVVVVIVIVVVVVVVVDVAVVDFSLLQNSYCCSPETIPRALASTPATFSLKARLPLE
eukprot:4353950-Pyramimonas_sp.AAC.1